MGRVTNVVGVFLIAGTIGGIGTGVVGAIHSGVTKTRSQSVVEMLKTARSQTDANREEKAYKELFDFIKKTFSNKEDVDLVTEEMVKLIDLASKDINEFNRKVGLINNQNSSKREDNLETGGYTYYIGAPSKDTEVDVDFAKANNALLKLEKDQKIVLLSTLVGLTSMVTGIVGVRRDWFDI
ncbi:MAG: hypothetical protein FWE47_01660 [Oscillospiraceae bacterium]|nr:hypothetical protein [Oscillospiraceae bacterium]